MIRLIGSARFFYLFLPLFFGAVIWAASELSISSSEALLYFEGSGYLADISRLACTLFGQNDYALRAFPFLMFALSVLLFYKTSLLYLGKKEDARIATAIFCLIPASGISAILLIKSSTIIFVTLLYIYLSLSGRRFYSFALLLFAVFLDNAFAILFLSLIFYSIAKKDNALLILSLICFGTSMTLFGFDDGGKPKGYFLDTLGTYLLIFSPILFFYFLFSLVKVPPSSRGMGWYISFWALSFSLLLSFRQKILLYDFAPFVMLAIPFMVKVFLSSYRVRIAANRTVYGTSFGFVFISVLLFFIVLVFNKHLYPFLDKKERHFAHGYYWAKELASELKQSGIRECRCDDKGLALRLKFYGIDSGGEYILSKNDTNNSKKVSISYSDTEITTYYVTKVNTF